ARSDASRRLRGACDRAPASPLRRAAPAPSRRTAARPPCGWRRTPGAPTRRCRQLPRRSPQDVALEPAAFPPSTALLTRAGRTRIAQPHVRVATPVERAENAEHATRAPERGRLHHRRATVGRERLAV